MGTSNSIGSLWDAPQASPSSAPSIGNLWDDSQNSAVGVPSVGGLWATPAQAPEPVTSRHATSVPASAVGDLWGSPSLPESGQAQPATTVDEPWYKRAWSWANKPLFDIDDALGRTGKASGVERGVNDLLSGLTSPLSLALTVGTLGAGGLIESGAASVLREAGIAGSEALADVTNGARIISKAEKAGHSFEEGLAAAEKAGVNLDTLKKGLTALQDAGVEREALTSNGLFRRGGSAALRRLGVGTAKAERVAQGIQSLVDGGFTVQQAYQAVELSPKVLDALKEGDYDTASRLAVDAVGSGGLAVLGARQVGKESGSLRDDVAEKLGLSVRDSDKNDALRKNFGVRDREVASASRTNDLWSQNVRKQFGKMTPESLSRVKYFIESSMDEDTMARRFNALAENADRDDRINVPSSKTPISSGMTADRLQEIAEEHPLAKKDSGYVDSLLSAYDPRKLTDAEKQLARTITEKHNDTLDFARSKDILGEGVENYSTNIWKPEDQNNPVTNRVRTESRQGSFSTNTSMARARMFDTAFEGQMLGRELQETDPIALAAHNANTFSRIAANRDAVARLLDQGTRGSDGLPLAVLSGDAHSLGEGEHASVLVNPDSIRSVRIPNMTVDALRNSGDLDHLLEQGTIRDLTSPITPENIDQHIAALENRAVSSPIEYDAEGDVPIRKMIDTLKAVRDGKAKSMLATLDKINAERPSVYAWDPSGHVVIDHPALHDWKHVTVSPNGDDVFVKSDIAVHPEAVEYLRRILGIDDQGVGAGSIGKVAQKINREGKGILLFGSPFHVMQEGLRGLMTGINPFGIEHWDLENDPELALGVEHGLTLGKDRLSLAAFKDGQMEGNSHLLSKIPGIAQVQHGLDHFLFDKYVPSLKVRAYRRLVNAYSEAYPEWTRNKVSEVAAADTNERFGGINYRRIGRAAATENWFKLVGLAPDWLESEVRAMSRPFGAEGKVARADMLKATAALWGTARVLNYLVSGKSHLEAPFGVAATGDDGKEKVYSIRTLPTDMLHAVSDPYGFIHGRFSPIAKTASQLISGRDEQGRKLQQSGIAADLFRAIAPIPAQTLAQTITGISPDVSDVDQFAKAAGLTVMPYRSEALKLAMKLGSDRIPSGHVDEDSLRHHQMVIRLEDDLRAGKITSKDLAQSVRSGAIRHEDSNAIVQNVRRTQGMSPADAALFNRAARLPPSDLLRVFAAASSSERKILQLLIAKANQREAAKE